METRQKMKMSPQVLVVILLTLVALVPPFIVTALGVAKYWKGRSQIEKQHAVPVVPENPALRQMAEAAAAKHFQTPELKGLPETNPALPSPTVSP